MAKISNKEIKKVTGMRICSKKRALHAKEGNTEKKKKENFNEVELFINQFEMLRKAYPKSASLFSVNIRRRSKKLLENLTMENITEIAEEIQANIGFCNITFEKMKNDSWLADFQNQPLLLGDKKMVGKMGKFAETAIVVLTPAFQRLELEGEFL